MHSDGVCVCVCVCAWGGGGQEEKEHESRKDDVVEMTGVKGKEGRESRERTHSGEESLVAGMQEWRNEGKGAGVEE